MGKIVSLKFDHDGQDQYCIVCIEKKEDSIKYTFKLKTAELQEILTDENVFVEKNDQIEVSVTSEDLKRSKLKLAIAKAITDYFRIKENSL